MVEAKVDEEVAERVPVVNVPPVKTEAVIPRDEVAVRVYPPDELPTKS